MFFKKKFYMCDIEEYREIDFMLFNAVANIFLFSLSFIAYIWIAEPSDIIRYAPTLIACAILMATLSMGQEFVIELSKRESLRRDASIQGVFDFDDKEIIQRDSRVYWYGTLCIGTCLAGSSFAFNMLAFLYYNDFATSTNVVNGLSLITLIVIPWFMVVSTYFVHKSVRSNAPDEVIHGT